MNYSKYTNKLALDLLKSEMVEERYKAEEKKLLLNPESTLGLSHTFKSDNKIAHLANFRLSNEDSKRSIEQLQPDIYSGIKRNRIWEFNTKNIQSIETQEITKNKVRSDRIENLGNYKEINNIVEKIKYKYKISDKKIAVLIEKIIACKDLNDLYFSNLKLNERDKIFFTDLTNLLFGTESRRNPRMLVQVPMMLELIKNGKMTFKDAFENEEFPMSLKGAVEAARASHNMYGNKYIYDVKGKKSKKVDNLLKKEDSLISKYIDFKIEDELLKEQEDRFLKLSSIQLEELKNIKKIIENDNNYEIIKKLREDKKELEKEYKQIQETLKKIEEDRSRKEKDLRKNNGIRKRSKKDLTVRKYQDIIDRIKQEIEDLKEQKRNNEKRKSEIENKLEKNGLNRALKELTDEIKTKTSHGNINNESEKPYNYEEEIIKHIINEFWNTKKYFLEDAKISHILQSLCEKTDFNDDMILGTTSTQKYKMNYAQKI